MNQCLQFSKMNFQLLFRRCYWSCNVLGRTSLQIRNICGSSQLQLQIDEEQQEQLQNPPTIKSTLQPHHIPQRYEIVPEVAELKDLLGMKRRQSFLTGTQVRVEVRSFDRSPCILVSKQIDLLANFLGVGKFFLPPNPRLIDHIMKREKRWDLHTVIRSPFKYNRSKEQFKVEHYKWANTYRVKQDELGRLHLFLHYIKTAEFAGVELQITVSDLYKGSVNKEPYGFPHYEQIN
eukprot:TRINITY_DN6652_c0_g1_i1.p2 TRINITY_DN6652_c0_g1~~TRINITY_DN6652_c0_g1_i1.p2  ORF type:complete len:234 (-),score=3.48 TRINITY_DN6652_c0_g1_i1:722-1423(-)